MYPYLHHTPQHTHPKNNYSGVYYWQRASREDTVQVKLETPDDETTTEILALGNVRVVRWLDGMGFMFLYRIGLWIGLDWIYVLTTTADNQAQPNPPRTQMVLK